ncbi:MAG: hypothetical protein RLZZ306_1596 [Bacteroidota bacterium]|jgi:hypothetical protein
MENQITFKKSVITEKQKAVIAYLEANNPDILDYYSKAELKEFIDEKIQTYYSEYEKQILLGFQPSEAEEMASSQLFNFKTSYSRLREILVEHYALTVDLFEDEIKEKMLYFSKEYRTLIDGEKSISTLIDSFFVD